MTKRSIALAMALSAVYLPPVQNPIAHNDRCYGRQQWQSSGGKRPAPKKR